MKTLSALTLTTAALLALAACNSKKDEGGLTAEDNRELNNAAEMLDASPDSLVASENVALGNGEQAAAGLDQASNGQVNASDSSAGNSE